MVSHSIAESCMRKQTNYMRIWSGNGSEDTNSDDWDFTIASEKIIVVNRNIVGIRSEYKGIVLLDTVLQTPLKSNTDIVQLELNVTEVSDNGIGT